MITNVRPLIKDIRKEIVKLQKSQDDSRSFTIYDESTLENSIYLKTLWDKSERPPMIGTFWDEKIIEIAQ